MRIRKASPPARSRLQIFLVLFVFWARFATAQIPEHGKFEYVLYDNGDRQVGTYFFTINKEGSNWRISSEMSIDTRFMLFPIRLKDENSFIHDGNAFQSFHIRYLKDVPLQRTVQLEVTGVRNEQGWTIHSRRDGSKSAHEFGRTSFEEVRNLVSRLVRPEAVLRPGEVRKSLSLDPLTLQISAVESRGIETQAIEFQGRKRELFVMETKASDGNVRVTKFANGLIYRSQTPEGYALLKFAQTPSF